MSSRGFLLALSIGCMCFAGPSYALDGKVIDGSTGQPLAGVFVIGAWQVLVPLPGMDRSGCAKLEIVRTDKAGAFAFSTWSGSVLAHLFGDETLNVYYYRRGYRWDKGLVYVGDAIIFVPDDRSPIEQLRRIAEPMENAECGPWDDRQAKALPMYRAMYEEAQSIAVSYEERQLLSGILFMVEWMELGEKRAHQNATERLNRGYR